MKIHKLNEALGDIEVTEWWGQTEENPYDVAKRYNLEIKKLDSKNDETLYRFSGSEENISRAKNDGYFYSTYYESLEEDIAKDKRVNMHYSYSTRLPVRDGTRGLDDGTGHYTTHYGISGANAYVSALFRNNVNGIADDLPELEEVWGSSDGDRAEFLAPSKDKNELKNIGKKIIDRYAQEGVKLRLTSVTTKNGSSRLGSILTKIEEIPEEAFTDELFQGYEVKPRRQYNKRITSADESLKEGYTFGLDDSVKEYIKYMTPDDYQVDKIRPNLTFGDVLSNMLSKRNNLLGTYVDSALSQKVLNKLEEIIGTDEFDKVYNNWVNSPVRRNRKISRNESLKEEDQFDFDSDVYNALADVMFKYRDKGVDKSDMDYALEWFNLHFWEMDFDESVNISKLKECFKKLNEAEMSDEDKADSALLRSIYNKTQQRANAKLTPEEKAVLDKYNLRRDSDSKNIRKYDSDIYWGNSLIDRRIGDKFNRWNQDETKINLADRARKMDDRGAGYEAGQTYYYDIDNDHREWQDPETGRWQRLKDKGLLDRERKHQNSVMYEPVRQMKDAVGERKYHQQHVDSNNAEYDARKARIQAEYEKKLRDNEDSRKWSGEYHQRELDRSKDTIDKLLKRDKKVNEEYTLVGQNGNAYALMGYTKRAMKECGLKDEVEEMIDRATSGDYYNLIAVCDEYIQRCNEIAGYDEDEWYDEIDLDEYDD